MPPPHSFWVILIGKTPTSFRAKEREDLVPTLRQLQRTQSDVTLRWFERGKVWESPEAAIGAAKLAATTAREKRTKEWRPGGEHRDPKARFEMTRDQKRAKFKREQFRSDEGPKSPFGPKPPREPREDRGEQGRAPRPRPDRPWSDRSKPGGRPDRPWSDRSKPGGPAGRSDRPWADRNKPGGPAARSDRPWSDRPKSPFSPRPPRGENRDDRPFGERPPRRDRPTGPPMDSPFKDRPRGDDRSGPRPNRRPFDGGRGERRPPSNRGGFKPPKRRS